jgi:hypothetical protein
MRAMCAQQHRASRTASSFPDLIQFLQKPAKRAAFL